MKKFLLLVKLFPFLLIVLSITKLATLTGCANMIPPSGGPRDSLPPVLIRAVPPDSSLGFKNKTIEFTFDEYIKLQSIQENLLISPTPETNPVVESRLRTLTVKFKDDFEPSTTYSLNFGRAIIDENEGNVLKDFTYIFSTGNALDSLELRGKVMLAETGGIDTTLIVMLHRSGDDSALVKEKPRYVTKLDGQGNFRFRFLPAGTFYLYALKDEGNTRKYFNTEQLFAFADSAINTTDENDPVTLYAYAEKKPAQQGGAFSFGGTRSGPARGDERRLRYGNSLSNNIHDLLEDFTLTFEVPVQNLDTSRLILSYDSVYTPVSAYSWSLDSTNQKLTLQTTWKENTLYNLILDKDFAEDTSGRKLLKTDTLHFTTPKRTDYGSVNITFRNLDTLNNHVLLFIQGGQVVKGFPFKQNVFYQPLFKPGDYDLRILYDKNGNNKWDPGEFYGKRIQPELVKPVDRKITIKADWDNEMEIAL